MILEVTVKLWVKVKCRGKCGNSLRDVRRVLSTVLCRPPAGSQGNEAGAGPGRAGTRTHITPTWDAQRHVHVHRDAKTRPHMYTCGHGTQIHTHTRVRHRHARAGQASCTQTPPPAGTQPFPSLQGLAGRPRAGGESSLSTFSVPGSGTRPPNAKGAFSNSLERWNPLLKGTPQASPVDEADGRTAAPATVGQQRSGVSSFPCPPSCTVTPRLPPPGTPVPHGTSRM